MLAGLLDHLHLKNTVVYTRQSINNLTCECSELRIHSEERIMLEIDLRRRTLPKDTERIREDTVKCFHLKRSLIDEESNEWELT